MDPNACMERFCAAVESEDYETADAAHSDLYFWLTRGGFEPTWDDFAFAKAEFLAWERPVEDYETILARAISRRSLRRS